MIISTLKKELKTFTLQAAHREEWFTIRRSEETKKRTRNLVTKAMWNHGREKQNKKVEMEGKDNEIQHLSLQQTGFIN